MWFFGKKDKETKINKTREVKDHFLEGKSLTCWDAIQMYNVTFLPKIVTILKNKGWNIKTKYERNGDSRYAVYWLDES